NLVVTPRRGRDVDLGVVSKTWRKFEWAARSRSVLECGSLYRLSSPVRKRVLCPPSSALPASACAHHSAPVAHTGCRNCKCCEYCRPGRLGTPAACDSAARSDHTGWSSDPRPARRRRG